VFNVGILGSEGGELADKVLLALESYQGGAGKVGYISNSIESIRAITSS